MLLLTAARCADSRSLEPSGPLAAKVARLWWFAFTIASVVYLLIDGRAVVGARAARAGASCAASVLDDGDAEPR